MDKRVIVTGGSGFIGTNVVASFLSAGHAVLSLDKTEPQNREHDEVFKRVDLLDAAALTEAFESFAPTHVVHMAARTDLHEKTDLAGYSANIEGVQNMVRAVSGQASVVRAMFASTKLVCPTDYRPQSMDDYCPDTLYGRSKVEGEEIVKQSTTMHCAWCIVRPTSTWGPWSLLPHIPYGRFFQMIGRGRYFHPGRADPSKSFSYVGNAVFQMEKLLDAPREQIHRQVFYLSDYDEFTIRDWADAISLQMRGKKVWTMPEPMVRLAAWGGDLMKLCGYPEPPLSSFRLRNMRADTTGVPLEPTERVTGPLPYSMEQGVEATIAWLSEMGTGT
ncbi:MAG: NAD-dependent epimerase/dehydratase family protein [Planctomycetota bacterium]|jgi:nucleoside-diphosphate-sugar epimerase